MGIDLKKQHSIMMQRLRKLFPKQVKIIYIDNKTVSVPCTISKEDIKTVNYDSFIGKNLITINILLDDLQKIEAPIKDFLYVVLDRVTYQVESSTSNGIFDNSIRLHCKIFKGNNS